MTRILLASLVLLLPAVVRAQGEDAQALAQEILDKGAKQFDKKDAAAMAATYTEDAQVFWVAKDQNTGEYKTEMREGRSEIEALYRDLFKDSNETTTSRNTVEYARRLAPDLLVIHGHFQPKISETGTYSFVQVRRKEGDQWKIMSLRLFIVSAQ